MSNREKGWYEDKVSVLQKAIDHYRERLKDNAHERHGLEQNLAKKEAELKAIQTTLTDIRLRNVTLIMTPKEQEALNARFKEDQMRRKHES